MLNRSFAVKDEIFCLIEGALDNLGSLRQQCRLATSANEVVLIIEAYKALHDRATYPLPIMLFVILVVVLLSLFFTSPLPPLCCFKAIGAVAKTPKLSSSTWRLQ
ncbi:hypothetical protein P8452_61184 [Trifolium repens]|nr:hypothetical protein P8452_03281 [Trifolium repens]WJX20657.1 hypothetical protein P8452_10186 [Trifolium repens]WJX24117.1 hypothetical protein P8452_13262 [Trifolium repens]WJX77916.1 hypothetical protein P8452_61184 [Trifolium repens]